jgi:hypothetical protein
MTSREMQILTGVGDAFDFMASQPSFRPQYGMGESPAMTALADAPDDTMLDGFDWSRPALPNEIQVRNHHELVLSIRALERVAQGPVRRGALETVTLHEGFHGLAAEQVGFQKVGYGLGIATVLEGLQKYTWYAFCTHEEPAHTPTKLEMAAIAVAPGEPSDADTHVAETLGYYGAADVISRVRDHNLSANNRPIPVPLCSELLVA